MTNFKIDHFVFAANTLSEGTKALKKILHEDLSEINTHEIHGLTSVIKFIEKNF